MSLYHKYRPGSFDEVYGNEATVAALQGAVNSDPEERPHAILITGPTGCGKTTLGRIFANELGTAKADYREVDNADLRGIDTIREIRQSSRFQPMGGDARVFLIDECHKLTNDAQNSLLKGLEDPPSHVYYILCTSRPDGLIKEVKGRCSGYTVEPLDDKVMKKLLHHIVKQEGEKLTKSVYEQIIGDSLGLPRNAIQTLDQVLAVEEEKRMEVAEKYAEKQSQTIELCRALMDPSPSWKKVSRILDGLRNEDPEGLRRAMMGYCRQILLKGQENDQAAAVMEEMQENVFSSGFDGIVFKCYSICRGE